MLHKMQLKEKPFEKIKNGSKTIELRLYDEKRQQIQVSDFIEFSQLDGSEKLTVRVTALHRFDSFAELYAPYSIYAISDLDHMNQYYVFCKEN